MDRLIVVLSRPEREGVTRAAGRAADQAGRGRDTNVGGMTDPATGLADSFEQRLVFADRWRRRPAGSAVGCQGARDTRPAFVEMARQWFAIVARRAQPGEGAIVSADQRETTPVIVVEIAQLGWIETPSRRRRPSPRRASPASGQASPTPPRRRRRCSSARRCPRAVGSRRRRARDVAPAGVSAVRFEFEGDGLTVRTEGAGNSRGVVGAVIGKDYDLERRDATIGRPPQKALETPADPVCLIAGRHRDRHSTLHDRQPQSPPTRQSK